MRKFFIAAAVAVISLIASGSSAQAAFSVAVYDDGVLQSVTVTPLLSNSVSYSATTTNFSVGGTADIQLAGNGTLHVSYTDNVTTLTNGTHTLTLLVTNTDYQLPASNQVLLTSSGGGSYTGSPGDPANGVPPDTVSGTTLGFLDPGNLPFGGVTVNPDGTVNATVHSTPASTTGTVDGTGGSVSLVYTPGTGASVVASTPPFSLTNVSVFTFSGQIGDTANLSNSVATAATPAPAGLVLALTGMPVLSLGAWVRRRRAATAG